MSARPGAPAAAPGEETLRRVRTLALRLELEESFLEECLACGALSDEDLPEAPRELPPSRRDRLRRLHRLCRGLDIEAFSGSIIVDLLERLDGLQRELDRLRG